MDTGLYSGVAAMRANEKRMDSIAANLANANTTAFKRQSCATRTFDVALAGLNQRAIAVDTSTDFTQGPITRTGSALDLALDGDGFLAVDSPSGEVYTRAGKLRLDERGVLQTADGHPVAWEGARGTISPVGDELRIDGSGAVRQGNAEIGRLRIRDFADRSRLTVDTLGYFHAPRSLARQAATATVVQGALEGSNVSSIDELVAMIQVQRSFETAASVLHTIDQSYRRLNAPR